jgi:hypothetical protein
MSNPETIEELYQAAGNEKREVLLKFPKELRELLKDLEEEDITIYDLIVWSNGER